MKKGMWCLAFCLLMIGYTQAQNCLDNQDCAAPQVLNLTTNVRSCLTDCNTGASTGPDFTGNNCHDFVFPTVWYQFTSTSNDATATIEITSSALGSPYFTVFTTTNCTNYTIVNCTQGSGGSADNIITLLAGTTYLIAVSDQNGATGTFDLCVTLASDNRACNTNSTLAATNTSLGSPLAGPFRPKELVTFCYTITDWQPLTTCNYLQGIVPEFGNCWDPVSFTVQGRPVTINTPLQTAGTIGFAGNNFLCVGNPAGTWSWFPQGAVSYNNITGSYPPNAPLPAGWYFTTSYNSATGACTPASTNPNTSYGDNSFPGCNATLDWTVCFTLQARDTIAFVNGQTDCSVSVKTFADGEIGAWNNVGCTSDIPTTFSNILCNPPEVNAVADISVCSGETVPASAFASNLAGATFTWTNNNPAIGLPASGSGDINAFVAVNNTNAPIVAQISVVAFKDCEGPIEVYTITINPLPNVEAGNPQAINCTNTMATLNGSSTTANTTFSWSGPGIVSGANTAAPVVNAAGNYTLTVTSAFGCTATDQVAVTTDTVKPTPLITPATVGLCAGQNATLTASGGNSYVWSNGAVTASITVSPAVNTTYTVTTTASNGCTASASRDVSILSNSAAAITPAFPAICSGESITLTATGGSSFSWSNGDITASITVSPAINTTYSVTVTDVGGCIDSASILVTVNALPNALVSPTTAQTCFGQPVDLIASGGSTYLWSNNETTATIAANPTATTTYVVTVTDVNGCTDTASATVSITSNFNLSETHEDVKCFGGNDGAIDLSIIGGTPPFIFKWSDNSTDEDRLALPSGTYSVTATGSDGCAASISAEILQPSEITVTGTVANESCSGNADGSIALTTDGGVAPYNYLWFDNDSTNTKTGLTQGGYTVTVSDANNCETINTFSVGIENPMILSSTVNQPTCPPAADGGILLDVTGGNGGFVYVWSDSAVTQNNIGLLPNSYSVTVTDSRGCSTTNDFLLSYQYSFDISVSPTDTLLFKGLSAKITTLANVNNSVSFVWTPSQGLSCSNCAAPVARPAETTVYTVVATDGNGCTDTDSVAITVEDIGNIFVPNSFSPNGDGANDFLAIYGARPEYMREFYFTVYDRWGEKVFETNNPAFTWDGTFKGKLLQTTVLIYYMKYVLVGSDDIEVISGSITLFQ